MTVFPAPHVGAVELRWLRPMAMWLRVGALGLSLLLMMLGQRPVATAQLAAAGAILVAYVAFRGIPRLGAGAELRSALAAEPVVAVVAILLSGGWASPYTMYLAVPMLFIGIGLGWKVVWLMGGICVVLSVQELLDMNALIVPEVGQTVVPMVVAGTVGVIARRIVRQTEDTQSQTLGRLQELSHVNALLSTLHDLVRSSSAPLTIEAVMASVVLELEELFEPDSTTLLLADPGGRFWRSVWSSGTPARSEFPDASLPSSLQAHERGSRAIHIPEIHDGGLDGAAVNGIYLWLWSRGAPMGLLALEHHSVHPQATFQLETLDRLASPLALALDNAIWFQRLRTLGAEEERQRLGAQLHDQFAQSLVYVAMGLDRSADRHPEDETLGELRTEVRRTLADLRETLRELRLNVTEDHGLVPTLDGHLERVAQRYEVRATLETPGIVPRVPLPIENQLLRVCQDLISLARRESGADVITVTLQADAGRLRMVVRDNGAGTPEEQLGHQASSTLNLVRERVDAIGGLVDVLSRPTEGTDVAVTLRGVY